MRDAYGKFWHNFRASAKGLYADRERSKVIFKSKYTDDEANEIMTTATKDDLEGDYLQRMKDRELQYLINYISDKEGHKPYSILVLTLNIKDAHDHSLKRYYSIEEYIVGMYNRGVEFTLRLSGGNELYVTFPDDGLGAIFAMRPEGDLLYRTMKHDIRFETEEYQFRTLCLEILCNKALIELSNEITEFERLKERQNYKLRPKKDPRQQFIQMEE